MFLSCLKPLVVMRRRARDAPPPGGRDARRVAAVTDVRRLPADGLQRALFNRDVHLSELLATLYFVRLRLADDAVLRRLHAHELEP